MELEILFRELISSVDALEPAGPHAWDKTSFLDELKHLPVSVRRCDVT
jgi:hypothetical protein